MEILRGNAKLVGPNTVSYGLPGRVDVGGTVTAKDIIIATGSVPFVPPGIPIDGKTVFTSDHALKLEWVPDWCVAWVCPAAAAPPAPARSDLSHASPAPPLPRPQGGHHRLRVHRPRVRGRLHGAGVRGDLHRGHGPHHARVRPGGGEAGRARAHHAPQDRLPHGRAGHQGRAGRPRG